MSQVESAMLQWARQRLERSRVDIKQAKHHIEHVKGRAPPVPGTFRVPAEMPELELELEFMLELDELYERLYVGVLQGTYRSRKILEDEVLALLDEQASSWQIWFDKQDRREEAARRAQEARWEEAQRLNEESSRGEEEKRHEEADHRPSNSREYERFLTERDQAREELRRQQRERFETQDARSQQHARRSQHDEQRRRQNESQRQQQEEGDRRWEEHRRRTEQRWRDEEEEQRRQEEARRRRYAEQQQRQERERRHQQEESRERERRQQEEQRRRREETKGASQQQHQHSQSNDHQRPEAEVPPQPQSSPEQPSFAQNIRVYMQWIYVICMGALILSNLYAPLWHWIPFCLYQYFRLRADLAAFFPEIVEEGERQRAEEERRRQDERRRNQEEKQRQDEQRRQQESRDAEEKRRKAQEEQRKAQGEQRKAQEEQRKAQEEQRKAQEERRRRENEQRRRHNQQQNRQHTAPPPQPTSALTAQQRVLRWRATVNILFADYRKITSFPCPPHVQACTNVSCTGQPNLAGCRCNIIAAFRLVPDLDFKKERLRWHSDRFAGCKDAALFQDMAKEIFVILNGMK